MDNRAADALSRDKLDAFFVCVPQALRVACVVPAELVGRLMVQHHWMSTDWISWLSTLSMHGSLAESTLRMYTSGQRRYRSFCGKVGVGPPPLNEVQVCRFVAYLAGGGLKHTTIKCYMAALRRLQIVEGLGDPFTASWPPLEYTIREVKLEQSRKVEYRPKSRFPVTPKVLKLLRDFWEGDRENRDHVMLWAACCMLFFEGWGGHGTILG